MPDEYGPDGYEPDGYGPDGYGPDGYEPAGYEPDGYGPPGGSAGKSWLAGAGRYERRVGLIRVPRRRRRAPAARPGRVVRVSGRGLIREVRGDRAVRVVRGAGLSG